jgi:pyruvate formate lyase activating enzyme
VLVEVTNLVIPTLNDSDRMLTDLCRWTVANLGAETPLHFSRFVPQYRLTRLPPTPAQTLDRARAIARAEGLRYVYIGNIARPDASDTFCHACGRALVRRRVYSILQNDIRDGACPDCGTEVYGTWR